MNVSVVRKIIAISIPDPYSVGDKAARIHLDLMIGTAVAQFEPLSAVSEYTVGEPVQFGHIIPAGKGGSFVKVGFEPAVCDGYLTPSAGPAVETVIFCIHEDGMVDGGIGLIQVESVIILIPVDVTVIRKICKNAALHHKFRLVHLAPGLGSLDQAIR